LLPNHAFSSGGVNAVEYGEKKKQVLRVTMDRLYDMLMQVGYLLAKLLFFSFHMFRSALEKPLNQIEPCSI